MARFLRKAMYQEHPLVIKIKLAELSKEEFIVHARNIKLIATKHPSSWQRQKFSKLYNWCKIYYRVSFILPEAKQA